MQNLLDCSFPNDLLTLPETVVDPPVCPKIENLPFDQLSWQDFERVVYRLVSKNSDLDYCARYGRPGQNQQGIDIYGRLSGGGHVCWQVKNLASVIPAEVTNAVSDFLKGTWVEKAKRFVLCFRVNVADTNLQDRIESEASRLEEKDIVLELVDGRLLSEKLKSHPEIIDELFGRSWVAACVGEDVAAQMSGRLKVQNLIKLRKRLGDIYKARIHQLDPGLNTELGRREPRDIRKRFVVPNVDPSNPFDEPLMEARDPQVQEFQSDDLVWQFAEHGDMGMFNDSVYTPIEPIERPKVALDDWLLLDERAMLIAGVPGSGKSTVLRCLALDLISTPVLFPRIHERLGVCIPLLVPFAIWTRLAAKEQREVGLPEVVRETFRAFILLTELNDSFIESLCRDERLVLLIDGLDEYIDVQTARTTLATIETFIRTNNVLTIATARPTGLQHLGADSGYWSIARIVELSSQQQREFATKLLDTNEDEPFISGRVEQFFHQLEYGGRLQSLAGNPLLLYGLLSVAERRILLPNTRFELFQKLVEILLDVHPVRRATAAARVSPRSGVFAVDEIRRETLSKLAYEIQDRGVDAGINRNDARKEIVRFLTDSNYGPAWSLEKARLGARELVDVDADTTGLLIESAPDEISFCHATFREHLAGLAIGAWDLEKQIKFVSDHADDPRWRAPIIALLQSLKRRNDVERILDAIQVGIAEENVSKDRRMLLAEGAITTAALSGTVGQKIANNTLDRIETGPNDTERFELLGLVLDGPRAGPVGEATITRLERWWPSVLQSQDDLINQLGNWSATDELAETLERALRGDRGQASAAASLAKAFKGNVEVGERLVRLVRESQNPSVTAAALDALSRGWPSLEGVEGWIEDAKHSSSTQLRVVGSLARYRQGRRGDEERHALLDAISAGWDAFSGSLHQEVINALVKDWADDDVLRDSCWAVLNHQRPLKYNITYSDARAIRMKLFRHDPRVPLWVNNEIDGRDYFPFGGIEPGDEMLGEIISENEIVHATVQTWLKNNSFGPSLFLESRLAKMLGTDLAKQAMLDKLDNAGQFQFWPVWSLLNGWGIEDHDVAAALQPLPWNPLEDRQYIAEHIPEIVGSVDESYRLLVEICNLPDLSRVDFVVRGFTALGDGVNEEEIVSNILRHIKQHRTRFNGEEELFARYFRDPRVRALAIERLEQPSPPLTQLACVYDDDSEIAGLILRRVAPLPTSFRRFIARRATQRFDYDALSRVLRQSNLETDEHAMIQATIGQSYLTLATPSKIPAQTEFLRQELYATGFEFEHRQAAAFAGLLALDRLEVFACATEREKDNPLRINLVDSFNDYSPAVELTAERWEEFESIVGKDMLDRLCRNNLRPKSFWRKFAPYASRSSLLKKRFLEYCADDSEVLEAPVLLALARIKPSSSLLLDCCKRTLISESAALSFPDLQKVRSTLIASKCLEINFPDDASALDAIVEASDILQHLGAALVALASYHPDHEIIKREYRNLQSSHLESDLLVCAELWLLSAVGTRKQFVDAFTTFVTRKTTSPWDFPEHALDAFQARLKRDPKIEEILHQLARDNDDPSIRASVARLLASMPATRGRELTRDLLVIEETWSGLPRFAFDILTNRVRPAQDLMIEAIGRLEG